MLWQCKLVFIDQGSNIERSHLAASRTSRFLAGQVTFKDHLHNAQGQASHALTSATSMTSLKWPTRENKMWELLVQRISSVEFKYFCEPCQPWSTSGVYWYFVNLFCMLNKTPEADILGLTATDGPQPDNRFVFQWIQSWLISLRTVSTLFVYGFSVGVSSCLKTAYL